MTFGRSTTLGWAVASLLLLSPALAGCGGSAGGSAPATPPLERAGSAGAGIPSPPSTLDRALAAPVDGRLRTTLDAGPEAGSDAGAEPILLFGDSLAVLIADELATMLPNPLVVDGADCRRLDRSVIGPCGGVPAGAEVSDGVTAVEDAVATLAGRGIVPDAAVFVLANNSSVSEADLAAVMEATAGIPHVWWVTTRIDGYGRQDPNNRMLAALAAADPRAGVVDWYAASVDRPWLADNVHPNEVGQAALARLVHDRLLCGCTS